MHFNVLDLFCLHSDCQNVVGCSWCNGEISKCVYHSNMQKCTSGKNQFAFFGIEGHVALDRNPGPGYDTLLLRLIQGDLLSACLLRQFHTLPGLLDCRALLSNRVGLA